MIKIIPLQFDSDDMEKAFDIRREVFLIEQNVDPEIEFEFEEDSHQFLAYFKNDPAGTARWRATEKGIKLERFAVLKKHRGKGVASALIEKILSDLSVIKNKNIIYLHAQESACPLYEKHGFVRYGDRFLEADIWHYKMKLHA